MMVMHFLTMCSKIKKNVYNLTANKKSAANRVEHIKFQSKIVAFVLKTSTTIALSVHLFQGRGPHSSFADKSIFSPNCGYSKVPPPPRTGAESTPVGQMLRSGEPTEGRTEI